MSTVSITLPEKKPPRPGPMTDAQKFLRDRIADLEKQIEDARQRHVVPLQNELEPLQRAFAVMTGTMYEGLGTLAAVRKLLIQRDQPMTQEDIAAELLRAGFKPQPRPGRGEVRELKRSPMTPEQKIVRSVARYVFEGELARDKEGRVVLPEWKKK